ncbi:MAG TPA: hypothetical protein VFT22_12105 [Kofleriaceae bacterium]|nr:hypothetical protein [Kofleriaceae bacterium]
MRRLTRSVVLAAVAVAVPVRALGQPAEPPPAPEGQGSGAPAAPSPAPGIDEAKVREIVDREIAQVLTERAAKEAAERAAKEAAEKEASATEQVGEVHGAGGFMDTRLAFTLTNENILAKPGETIPSAPGWRFGTPNSLGVLFFDNYDTRYSGFETLSHATMYREVSRGHLQAEGAFVLRINELTENNISLSDDGTYLTLTDWKDPTHKDPTRISLTAFPVSADRFRLGYSYRLSWGGNPEYKRARSSTPGVKLQYDGPSMYAFVGAKSALVVDPKDGEQKAALAVLGGAGFDPTPMLRFELNGGYFDRGYNELQDVQREKVRLFGASAQASIHQGVPLRSSLDYRLYKFNGESVAGLFAPERYPGGLSWLAQAEFTVLGQTLKDPERTGSTVNQFGKAGDLNVRVKLDRIRLRLDLSYRDLAFILHSQPSLPPYEDFPSAYTTSADYFAAIGADNNWGDWLTVGLIAGIEKPATLTSPKGIPGAQSGMGDTMGTSTAVVRNNNIDTLITILPAGESAVSQLAVKATAKVDFAKIFSALLEVFYSYDGNQTRYIRTCGDPQQCPFAYVFGQFNQLGLNATLQARF